MEVPFLFYYYFYYLVFFAQPPCLWVWSLFLFSCRRQHPFFITDWSRAHPLLCVGISSLARKEGTGTGKTKKDVLLHFTTLFNVDWKQTTAGLEKLETIYTLVLRSGCDAAESQMRRAIDKSGKSQRAGCTLMPSCTIINQGRYFGLLVNQILTCSLYFSWTGHDVNHEVIFFQPPLWTNWKAAMMNTKREKALQLHGKNLCFICLTVPREQIKKIVLNLQDCSHCVWFYTEWLLSACFRFHAWMCMLPLEKPEIWRTCSELQHSPNPEHTSAESQPKGIVFRRSVKFTW